MAQTVTVTGFARNVQHTTQAGKTTTKHTITYENAEGKSITASIFQQNPLYETLSKHALIFGKQYDFEYTKNEAGYNNLSKIAPANTLPKTASKGNFYKKNNFQQNPDRDLSMDLGGLMHDAATLIAAGKRTSVADTLLELYNAKHLIIKQIKEGKLDVAETPDNNAALAEQKTQSVVSFSADDENDPF